MSTIEEEPPTVSDSPTPVNNPVDNLTSEQAREYQRALVEAMPNSVADGFTRASVSLPTVMPEQASKFANAPLKRYKMEPYLTSPARQQDSMAFVQFDELSQSPLLHHEVGIFSASDASEEPDELEQAPLMRHESTASDATDIQRDETNESEQAPLTQHETGLPDDDSQYDIVDEFDHAPLMRHESGIGEEDDELDQAPLMRHESIVEEEDDDELEQAPLMRHESNIPAQAAYADTTTNPILSYGTTLVGEDAESPGNNALFQWRRQSAVYHAADSGSSIRHSGESEQLIFPMDSSQNIHPYRASSVYSEDWATDESGRSGWDSEAINFHLRNRRELHDTEFDEADDEATDEDEGVNELDRVPTMPYESADNLASQTSDTTDTGDVPILSYEAGYSSETEMFAGSDGLSSKRHGADRSDSGSIGHHQPSSRTNSFQSQRLREVFKGRIFGSTRQRFDENENEVAFAGAPLLSHERLSLINVPSTSDSRPFSNAFRAPRSDLPHKMPRSDAEDLNLLDSSLEIFPMDKEGVLNQVRDISNRLPEDMVRSSISQELGSPAILSQTSSSVDLAPIRSGSNMSLQSIREDASENGDLSLLPSPVFATRVPYHRRSSPIPIMTTEEIVTPVPKEHRYGYFGAEGGLEMANTAYERDTTRVRRRIPIMKRPAIQYEEDEGIEDDDPTKRQGRVFDAIALPPKPPAANVALPPRAHPVSFLEPSQTPKIRETTKPCRTPYPDEEDEEDRKDKNIAATIYRHLRSCLPSRSAR